MACAWREATGAPAAHISGREDGHHAGRPSCRAGGRRSIAREPVRLDRKIRSAAHDACVGCRAQTPKASEVNMSTEVWGTFSVQDHLAERAFIADVLLYDRLVIPTKPDGQDPAEWPKDWDLARQQELLDVLGDLAVPIPWTQDIRADWKKNYEDALGKDRRRGKSDAIWRVGFDVERVQERPDDFHLHVSRMLLADYANEVADSRL